MDKNGFHEKHWSIRIGEGELEGVVYQYDTVSISEEGENAELKFNTITIENPDNKDLTLESNINIMGDILVDLINQGLKEREKNAPSGTGDTEASSQ
jgi:hypothetical protein